MMTGRCGPGGVQCLDTIFVDVSVDAANIWYSAEELEYADSNRWKSTGRERD